MRIYLFCIFFLFSAITMKSDPIGDTYLNPYERDVSVIQSLQLQQRFAFDPYPGAHAQTVNEILQKIADGMGKLRVNTSYTFFFEINLAIDHVTANRYRLTANAEAQTVTGDVLYRDFSLAKVLIPDRAHMRILARAHDGKMLAERNFKALDISSENESLFEIAFAFDGGIEDIRFEFLDVFFFYDERMDERFGLWTKALESYYATGQKLDRVSKLIDGLDTAKVETLLLDEFNLCEAESVLGDIMFAPFHHWIDFRDNDPDGIYPVYESLALAVDSLRYAYNHAIAGIDSLYYRHGLALLADSSLQQGRAYFLSAISYNPFHIPSHLALARLEAARNDSVAALQRMGKIYEVMHPLPGMKVETDHFTDSVLGIFYDASWLLITERRHTESLDVLAHVADFCMQASPVYRCSPLFNMLFRQSHRGVYFSFISVSERALRNDNPSLASTYLQNAIQYQQVYSEYIGDHFEALDLLARVFTRYRIQYELKIFAEDLEAAERLKVSARVIPEAQPALLDHIASRGTTEDISTAVINYAILGFPEESLILLHRLKDKGLRPSSYAYHQRLVGVAWARQFRVSENNESMEELFNRLRVIDPWFAELRDSFLQNM